MMKKYLSLMIFFIIAVMPAIQCHAATIKGSVYDISFTKLDDTIVSIDTIPVQNKVAVSGDYSFEAPPGRYTIIARQYDAGELMAEITENVTITDEGEYVIDLILFPSFASEQELIDDLFEDDPEDVEPVFIESRFSLAEAMIALGVLALLIYLIYLFRRRADKNAEKDVPDLASEVIDFIKEEGGRTTQKDIRKNFPQSEAKISLVMTELSDMGRIKKIKKGRSNVIILEKLKK